jgi:hypothetical protein
LLMTSYYIYLCIFYLYHCVFYFHKLFVTLIFCFLQWQLEQYVFVVFCLL